MKNGVNPLSEEFRKSKEYKAYASEILSENPNTPEWIIDTAIALHMSDPFLFQKIEKMKAKGKVNPPKKESVIDDKAIKVFENEEAYQAYYKNDTATVLNLSV